MAHTSLTLPVFDAAQTTELLPFAGLLDALETAVHDLAAQTITAPERQVVAWPNDGVMLSMPATAADIGIHKLVNVVASNSTRGVPTINGVVCAYNGVTGEPLFMLDGPTVTLRRTAAVSMLGLRIFKPGQPSRAALVGTGTQARGHALALADLYPGCQVAVVGSSATKAEKFVQEHAHLNLQLAPAAQVPDDADVVITLTTSKTPVYDQAARHGRLIIGVGAFKPELAEIGPNTLAGSALYVDDPLGARHEAGDFIQAGVDWSLVRPLAAALKGETTDQPVVYKTVGCAAWDLAAARCARANLPSLP
jgi:1-piperideine-2-carboxylate/1-pyrroline-2-carboxylate reductase [NAD(P)H]